MIKKLHYPGNKKQRPIVCGVRLCAFCLAAILLAAFAVAADDYSLEYSAISLDGGQSQATDYEVIGLLKAEGVDGESQSSTDYAVATTTGLKEGTQTTVEDWNLY